MAANKPVQFERGLPKSVLTAEPINGNPNQTGKQLVERKVDYAGAAKPQPPQSPFAGT